MALLTMTTDFGGSDSYVAEMKGVLLSSIPTAALIDITHEVPPFSINEGAFQILRSFRFFGPAAYHLVVVDPGVGTSRKCLFIRTGYGSFVGPDNGVLKWAVDEAERLGSKKAEIFEIPVPSGVQPTFYGRDVFAPFLVMHLRGKKTRLQKLSSMMGQSLPEPLKLRSGWKGVVLSVDHFGNCVTNLPVKKGAVCMLKLGKKNCAIAENYQAIPSKSCALIPGSHGFWEIAAREASAADKLKLKVGSSLEFSLVV